MDPSFTLWECPPLRARITLRQCAANRAHPADGGDAGSRKRVPRGVLEKSWHASRPECTACQGVAWWAEHNGRAPQVLFTSEVVAELERKEALRRRMSGAGNRTASRADARSRRRAASSKRAV